MEQTGRHAVRRDTGGDAGKNDDPRWLGWVPLTPWQTVTLTSLSASLAIVAAIHLAVRAASAGNSDPEATGAAAFLTLFAGMGIGLSGVSMLSVLLFRGYLTVRLPEVILPVKGRWVFPFLLLVLVALLGAAIFATGARGAAIAIGLWGLFMMPGLIASDACTRKFD
jgi:hypothetical protein